MYFYKTSGHKLGIYYSSQIATGSTSLAANTWYHIAVSRVSGTLKLFLDGVQDASVSNSTNLTQSRYSIGDSYDSASGPLLGTASNVRVIKGTGLYTASFTKPSTPLTNVTNTKLLCCQSSSSTTAAAVAPNTLIAGGSITAGSELDWTVNNLTAADNGYIRGTSGAFFYGSREQLFNGNTGNGLCPGSSGTAGTFDVTVTFNPAISCTSLQVWSANKQSSATGSVSVNGGTHQSVPGTGSYTTLTAPSGGTLSSLVLRRVATAATGIL